jgi:hypothetical protein
MEIFQVVKDDTFQFFWSVQMQRFIPAQQAEGRQQAENAKDMITMPVAEENMMDLAQADPVFAKLHLGTLATINQIKPLIHIQQMSGRKSF